MRQAKLKFILDNVVCRITYDSRSNFMLTILSFIVSMSPPRRQRYCWNIAFATGCRRVGRRKWTNRRIESKEVEEYVTKVIAKDDLMENEQVYAMTGFGTSYVLRCILRIQKMPPHRATGEDENPPDIATLLAQQLQNLLPKIVRLSLSSVVNKAFDCGITQVQVEVEKRQMLCLGMISRHYWWKSFARSNEMERLEK
ncbi:hypothetical protein Tco_0251689 [Tanacetum coccineum]